MAEREEEWNTISDHDQDQPRIPDEDDIGQDGQSIPATGDPAPRLTVTHFIETIEKRRGQQEQRFPKHWHLIIGQSGGQTIKARA